MTTTDLPPVLAALACCDEHPFIPGALYRVVGPHDLHDYDGLGDWAVTPDDTKDPR